MDFLKIIKKVTSKGAVEVIPDFLVKTKDLMRRGGEFYAYWDEENKEWCQNESKCIEAIDKELKKKAEEIGMPDVYVRYLNTISTGSYYEWKKYLKTRIMSFWELNKSDNGL